jgi:hypothetical protein
MGLLAAVRGVGGRPDVSETAAEARILLFGVSSLLAEVIVASAAFRFLVMGGIVAAGESVKWENAHEGERAGSRGVWKYGGD